MKNIDNKKEAGHEKPYLSESLDALMNQSEQDADYSGSSEIKTPVPSTATVPIPAEMPVK